jgi:regulator of protease activity HflC (stomatin/prohibitin superfamily)
MSDSAIVTLWIVGILLLIGLIVAGMAGCPRYRVWSKGLAGKGDLEKQEYAKKILVEQAKAELESAKHLAAAEVERAKGIAESMQIISGQLKDNPEYLQYWAIQAQMKMAAEGTNHSTVYIPSGANGIPLVKMTE